MNLLSIIIDLALVAVFVLAVIKGRRNGFVKTVLSIIATIIAVVVAKEFCEPIAIWIEENLVRNAAMSSIANVLEFKIGGTIEDAISAIPPYILNAAEYAGVEIESFVSGGIITDETSATATQAIYSAIKEVAIIPAAKVVAFFVVYAIVNAILSIGISLVNKIFKLPVLKGINRLLGGIIGAVKGVFETYVISAVIGFLSMLIPTHEFPEAVEQTILHSALWESIISFLK